MLNYFYLSTNQLLKLMLLKFDSSCTMALKKWCGMDCDKTPKDVSRVMIFVVEGSYSISN